ncbi:hypothetical protein V6N13_126064 [Hibiscus sabdariffa]|uniref:Uncharacterized protein n=2 Tax=Hibiscus sabdariffa TaxID=183260 RepID=A0ABR2ARS4_9ROSI
MEHEIEDIDWNNIDSVFQEDDAYENFNAPKWVDLSAPSQTIDDDAWFCKPGNVAANIFQQLCLVSKKIMEITVKETHTLFPWASSFSPNILRLMQVKLLRSRTISEILPFRDRTRREANAKIGSKPAKGLNEENENRNPNVSTPPLPKKSSREEKTQRGDLKDKSARKKELKSSLSARNLVGGRDVLSQISELCAELKRMARKGSKKGAPEKASGGVLGDWKERGRSNKGMSR